MKAKTVFPVSFDYLYDAAPAEIKEYIDRCEKTFQSAQWHPEGNCARHIRIVFNRAKRTEDVNLMLAAFFHDLGKADVTRQHPTIRDKWSAHGHEVVSARLAEKYRNWIERMGGDFDIIYYLVKEHMRAKNLNEMKPAKAEAFKNHPYFNLMLQFNEFDDMIHYDWKNDLD